MINQFDKETVRKISADIQEKLTGVAANYGITIQQAGGTFDVTTATIKLKLTVLKTASGEGAEQAEFKQYAHLFGLKPEHYGATFASGLKRYKLIGLKVGASKRPIIGMDIATSKRFVFEVDFVAKALGIKLWESQPFTSGTLTETPAPGSKKDE